MTPGLVSVTFRKLSPVDIIGLCRANRLACIEWGGDIHVPPGDLSGAERTGALTREAGLSVACYGSYYRLSGAEGPDFRDILDTAVALGAPVIRVWAGSKGSAEASGELRQKVASDALRCADLAAARGITIAYEFHGGTLTDTTASACDLLAATEHPHIKSLWQPPHGCTVEECLESLRPIIPRLQHLHVFHWWPEPSVRHPLSEGRDRWVAYVGELRRHQIECPLLLEFVKGDDPSALPADAETLNAVCG